MPAHILQVAYYHPLQELRAEMLRATGYLVTSVSGNNEAMGLNGAAIAAADLVLSWLFRRTSGSERDSSLVQITLPEHPRSRVAVPRVGEVC